MIRVSLHFPAEFRALWAGDIAALGTTHMGEDDNPGCDSEGVAHVWLPCLPRLGEIVDMDFGSFVVEKVTYYVSDSPDYHQPPWLYLRELDPKDHRKELFPWGCDAYENAVRDLIGGQEPLDYIESALAEGSLTSEKLAGLIEYSDAITDSKSSTDLTTWREWHLFPLAAIVAREIARSQREDTE